MLSLDYIVRRVLMYRVLRHRLAWYGLALIGYYLTFSLVLFIAARHQTTSVGPFATCRVITTATDGLETTTSYLFSVQDAPERQLQLNPATFTPALPGSFCATDLVNATSELSTLQGPSVVDRVTLRDPVTGVHATYTTPAGLDFEGSKRLTLLTWGGGMGIVSTAMLVIALFWRFFGRYLRPHNDPRSSSPLPGAFLDQVSDDLRWLETLPWGMNPIADIGTAYAAFHRGIALLGGPRTEEDALVEGVKLLLRCPPALAWTGAAEAALRLAAHDAVTLAPEGARAALKYAERALALSPNIVEAHLARAKALAALASPHEQAATQRAEAALNAAREAAQQHPRLPRAEAAQHLAQGRIVEAVAALRQAIAAAPTPGEADALREQLAHTLARTGTKTPHPAKTSTRTPSRVR